MIRLLKSANPLSPAAPQAEVDEAETVSTSVEVELIAAIAEVQADPMPDQVMLEADADIDDAARQDMDAHIATILALIRSGKTDDLPDGPPPEETGATYELLTELDRIWNNA